MSKAFDEKKRPSALKLNARTGSSDSNSSSDSSLKIPRTPRFAEATSVHSPIDSRSPFADPPEQTVVAQAQVGDIGFGYMNQRESITVPMTPKSPLKSAMKTPRDARRMENPMSPTFREEDVLEKKEARTEKEQKRDLRIKTRVRMAKFALRGVNFSCSLIILAMLSTSFAIFNATRLLPSATGMPAWAPNTPIWPQILALTMACISLVACIIVFIAYFRGGHRRAEKVATYYTLFAIGWFVLAMVLWAVTAAVFQSSRNNNGNKDMWGWSCVENPRSVAHSQDVDYQLVCRLQNWTLICIVIEIVVEAICILLYSVVFYRYWTKRRLAKSMDMRDKARTDLYLAQLRSQSAPNTPGFGPKSPALSQYALSPRFPPSAYRNLGDIEESPFTPAAPAAQVVESKSTTAETGGFRLQPPPPKAPSATPRSPQIGSSSSSSSPVERTKTPPTVNVQDHMDDGEPQYGSVSIPGAYAGARR